MPIVEQMIASEKSTIRNLRLQSTMGMLGSVPSLRLFKQLLRTTVRSSLGDTKPTLETLQLNNTPFDHIQVASICSALRYPTSLKKLHLGWNISRIRDGASAKLIWAWIAFGIFHPDAEAMLDRLNLLGPPLKPEDTATFASIIQSAYPGRQLWELEHGDLPKGTGGLEEIALPASRRVLAQLIAKTNPLVAPNVDSQAIGFLASHSEECEVATDFGAWVCVVVRGCGLGWVQSTSTVSRREVASKCRPVSPEVTIGEAAWCEEVLSLAGENVKVFDRITFAENDQEGEDQLPEGKEVPIDHGRYGSDPIEQTISLLQMIGHCLDGLHYSSYYQRISEPDLSDILDACPHLMQLTLMDGRIASLTPLADRYRAQQCSISSLNIATEYGSVRLMSQLAELLESPFSKPLRFVTLDGRIASTACFWKLDSAL